MSRSCPALCASYVLAASIVSFLTAQEPVFTIDGTQDDDSLGRSVAVGSDWNLDGIIDIAIGIPGRNGFEGLVELRSGRDGTLIRTIAAPANAREFGTSIDATLDFTGDGHNDLVVGAPFANLPGSFLSPGTVYLINGTTGAVIHSSTGVQDNDQLGECVLALQDVNGDGTPDFAASGTGIDGPGSLFNCGGVRVFSGATGAALYTRLGWAPNVGYGVSLTRLRDVNGDARPDWVSGGEGVFPNYLGTVEVCSGATGLPIATLPGVSANGIAVARAHDLDGDGSDDFWLGRPGFRNASAQLVGRVEGRSGRTGALLFGHDGNLVNTNFGTYVIGLRDLDGDALPEFAAFRNSGSSNREVQLRSGRTGAVLRAFSVFSLSGHDALDAGDLNSGGFDELLIGDDAFSPSGFRFAGRAQVFALADRFLTSTPDRVTMPGPLSIELRGAAANGGFLVFVVQANGLPIGPYLVGIGTCNAEGRGSIPLNVPVVPGLQSLDFFGASLGAPLPSIAFTNLWRTRFQ
ncbi:MAG: FG-GAP repeat protein [Planctomycetes bacterium]|nr:FG-GAP repeat protein [Planctomycetota bacterium]